MSIPTRTSPRRLSLPSAPDALPARPAGTPADPAIILGIDPGSQVAGYGIVRWDGSRAALLTCGALRPKGADIGARLVALYDGLAALIREWGPHEAAIEEPFTRVNARSAFVLGKAQAALILAAAHARLPVFEYTPAAVKQSVSGYGRGGKEQVGEMVRMQLGLPSVPQPADAADALAVALCHTAHRRIAAMAARR